MPAFSRRWFLLVGALVLASIAFVMLQTDAPSDESSLRRQLSYFDPRSTETKPIRSSNSNSLFGSENLNYPISATQDVNNNINSPAPPKSYPPGTRHILSLGGSTTWGSKLEDRESSYPYLLPKLLGDVGNFVTHNLAVRATDASYACQCVQTMIIEGCGTDELEMDLILLEYSLNGLDGMDLLLKRLRRRYPKAQIVYVHLWSLRMNVDNAITGEKPRDELNKGLKFVEADVNINKMLGDPDAKWKWGEAMMKESQAVANRAQKELDAIKGYVFQVPVPENPAEAFPWFGPDYHHLNENGHRNVASAIVNLLQNVEPIQSSSDVSPSWGDGDKCFSWYESGNHKEVEIEGGTMKMFVKPDKYAVHVGKNFGQPAKFTFSSPANEMPVMLMIMSWGEGVYPKSETTLETSKYPLQTLTIDPLHPNPLNHVFHVTRTVHIGWANQGKSILTVNPIEEQQRPLRVIGIVMCGACIEMDKDYIGGEGSPTHQRLGGSVPKPSVVFQGGATLSEASSNQVSTTSSIFGRSRNTEEQPPNPKSQGLFSSSTKSETKESSSDGLFGLSSSEKRPDQAKINVGGGLFGSDSSTKDSKQNNSWSSLFGSSENSNTVEHTGANGNTNADSRTEPAAKKETINESHLTEEELEELRNTDSNWQPRPNVVDSNTKEKHQASFFTTFGGGGGAIGNTDMFDHPEKNSANKSNAPSSGTSTFDSYFGKTQSDNGMENTSININDEKSTRPQPVADEIQVDLSEKKQEMNGQITAGAKKIPAFVDVQQQTFISRLSSEDPNIISMGGTGAHDSSQPQQNHPYNQEEGGRAQQEQEQKHAAISQKETLGNKEELTSGQDRQEPVHNSAPLYGNNAQQINQAETRLSGGGQQEEHGRSQMSVSLYGSAAQQLQGTNPSQQQYRSDIEQQSSNSQPQAMQQQQYGQNDNEGEPVPTHYEHHSSHLRLKDHRHSFPAN